MTDIDLSAVGLTAEEVLAVRRLTRGTGEYTLNQELAHWNQYSREVSRGELWTWTELEVACHARDDLELTLQVLESAIRNKLFVLTDRMDAAFRDATVDCAGPWRERQVVGRWWWGRIPRSSAQRFYLFNLD